MIHLRYAVTFAAGLMLMPAHSSAQTLAGMSGVDWLSHMERLQAARGDPARHVHFDARIEGIDISGGVVTVVHPAMRSGDGSIAMPAMRMTFHVTSSSKLKGLSTGDMVHAVVGRYRGAIMITEIRKVPS